MIRGARLYKAAATVLRVLEEAEVPVPAWKLSHATRLGFDPTSRDTRRAVALLVENGFPIVHVHGRGYKLARTDEEVVACVEKLKETRAALTVRLERLLASRTRFHGAGYVREGRSLPAMGRLAELVHGA